MMYYLLYIINNTVLCTKFIIFHRFVLVNRCKIMLSKDLRKHLEIKLSLRKHLEIKLSLRKHLKIKLSL